MSYTPFNAPLLAGYLGEHSIASHYSVDADLKAMLQFEVALAAAQASCSVIETSAAQAIERAGQTFTPDLKSIAARTATDGVAVPAFVAQLRQHVGDAYAACVHHGATSQDVIDTSLMIRHQRVFAALTARLEKVVAHLERINASFAEVPLMARTRMQRALPISGSEKICAWAEPLRQCAASAPRYFPVQLGGPEGAGRSMQSMLDVTQSMAERLGLDAPLRNWQTNRQVVIDQATWAMKVSTALGKIGQDVALMAQNEVAEVALASAGGSSAMPHKRNPVIAESLVTLARFCATLIGGLHQAALHENERSGSSWSLEWMLVPQLMVATGASLRNAESLLAELKLVDANRKQG